MRTPPVRLVAVNIAATDSDRLAHFWARALRWDIGARGAGSVDLVPTDPTSFRIIIVPGAGAKLGQNRIHLDLTTQSSRDQRDTVTELMSIGASHADVGQSADDTHVVLADPDGNELCVIAPGNQFLASCPRLGAVNCDGTSALGRFFSLALGWPLVWDQDEETAIQAPNGTGPKITWSGSPLIPQLGEPRIHLHLAPLAGGSIGDALKNLLGLGAHRLDAGSGCSGAVPIADVDGNRLCLVPS